MSVKISEAKSAKLVWSIRKALIHATFILVSFLEMAGFRELSTAVCVSLLEFNVFVPLDITIVTDYTIRVNRFKSYWEDVRAYRVGDVDGISFWSDSKRQE